MKQDIEAAELRIEAAQKAISLNREFIAAAQKICQHKWTAADDLYNYHTRTEYQRCTECGLVV